MADCVERSGTQSDTMYAKTATAINPAPTRNTTISRDGPTRTRIGEVGSPPTCQAIVTLSKVKRSLAATGQESIRLK